MFLLFLLITFGLALIPANIAQKKGRSFGGFYVYGFFFFGIALIHALVMEDRSGQYGSNNGMRPRTPEEIFKEYMDLKKNIVTISGNIDLESFKAKIISTYGLQLGVDKRLDNGFMRMVQTEDNNKFLIYLAITNANNSFLYGTYTSSIVGIIDVVKIRDNLYEISYQETYLDALKNNIDEENRLKEGISLMAREKIKEICLLSKHIDPAVVFSERERAALKSR